MSQFASFHLPDGSTFVGGANFDVVGCRGIQVLGTHLNQRKGALGAAQEHDHAVFALRAIPLPCGPGLFIAAGGQKRVKVPVEVRLSLAVLADCLLDPGDPGIVVGAVSPKAYSIASVIAETHKIQVFRRSVGASLCPRSRTAKGNALRSPCIGSNP